MSPDIAELFPGFEDTRIETPDTSLAVLTAGHGPALLLLHGYPETRAAWHRLAGPLSANHSVVIPDLPGYGQSRITADPQGAGSKRRMAAALHHMMQTLGHRSYTVIGHDRGGRVAYRMALDYPDAVAAIVSITVVPTPEMWEGANKAFGMGAWHWFMLAQPAPLPEKLLASDPQFFLETTLAKMAGGIDKLDPRALADYRRAFDDPSVRQAICEDYRAGATTDEADDRKDRAERRRLHQPVFVIWEKGRRYGGGREPLDIWRDWSDDPQGIALEGGHLLPETAAPEILEALHPFLKRVHSPQ